MVGKFEKGVADGAGFGLREGAPVAVEVGAAEVEPPVAVFDAVRVHERDDDGAELLAVAAGKLSLAGERVHKGHEGNGAGDFGRMLAADDEDVVRGGFVVEDDLADGPVLDGFADDALAREMEVGFFISPRAELLEADHLLRGNPEGRWADLELCLGLASLRLRGERRRVQHRPMRAIAAQTRPQHRPGVGDRDLHGDGG